MPPPTGEPKRRRLLSLPAVYPCECIAPARLLASLLSLAADLTSRGAGAAGAFPVLRRGVRQAVRIAGLLLAFLEEIQDATVTLQALPASAVLGLTELHVAMQKIRFLLNDCARRGARLWVLVNAGLVASELRVVLGSVAVALDALPKGVVDASVEAGELARLLSEQAWRVPVRPDAGDERAARSVRSILEQFKSGVSPEAEDARRVLEHIGVRTWSECSEEIACLDDELYTRMDGASDDTSSDAVLVNSLMAFLVYCRVVLFDQIDTNPKADAAVRPARCPDWIRPDALQCPITLDLMTDPVTVSTGQTYDRASIMRWIKAGCRTCPVTGERLRTADVVSNAALRGIIERMLLSNGVSLPDASGSGHRHGALGNTPAPFGPAAAGAARLSVAYIVAQLSTGSTEERRKATSEARKLSKHSVFYRACLVEANAVPWLLCLLSSTDASVQDNAVASLLNLSKHPRGRAVLFEAGGVGLVVDVINVGGRAEARQNAAAVLFYLSSDPEHAEEIGRIPEAIPTLVQLVRDGAHRGRKNAMVSLYGLLQCASNHGKAVAAGAVAALAALLSVDRDNDLAVDAVALLARLAEHPVGAQAVLVRPGLVSRVVEALAASASRSGKDHCVALLVSLCRHGGEKVVALLGRMPGLMASLYTLVADGSPQACKRARALLNMIHRHYEMGDQPAAPASSEAGERVVRVL
ncbi:U-box domain-containing protein 19 [Dichanthelium oligosanthes]|uniref:RING-type E3 ubiquitin transferase n=1 Tax=Dichanthelium oligosanthes TaxID=888268 RepID=A0A1E5WAY4_9POAL|nr:U-box domain-containing protein 19 [Dichanthelium oligosanthes]